MRVSRGIKDRFGCGQEAHWGNSRGNSIIWNWDSISSWKKPHEDLVEVLINKVARSFSPSKIFLMQNLMITRNQSSSWKKPHEDLMPHEQLMKKWANFLVKKKLLIVNLMRNLMRYSWGIKFLVEKASWGPRGKSVSSWGPHEKVGQFPREKQFLMRKLMRNWNPHGETYEERKFLTKILMRNSVFHEELMRKLMSNSWGKKFLMTFFCKGYALLLEKREIYFAHHSICKGFHKCKVSSWPSFSQSIHTFSTALSSETKPADAEKLAKLIHTATTVETRIGLAMIFSWRGNNQWQEFETEKFIVSMKMWPISTWRMVGRNHIVGTDWKSTSGFRCPRTCHCRRWPVSKSPQSVKLRKRGYSTCAAPLFALGAAVTWEYTCMHMFAASQSWNLFKTLYSMCWKNIPYIFADDDQAYLPNISSLFSCRRK